jgi:N-acetylneuraminic acid mutarotase
MSPAPSGLGLYVFNFDAIYYYNIALNFWKELSWFNHSTVVGGSAITLGDSVYLVGGATNNASQQQNFDSFVAFEPTSGRFTSLPPLPVGRLSPFLCSDGSRIFVLGGITRNYTNYQHLNTFDLTTSTWTTSRTSPISWPPFEDGLAIQAAVYHGGLVYAFFGGDLVQSYNPNSDSWAIVQSQTPQKDIGILFGAVTFASQIFFFGGFSALDAVMLSTAGTFVPPP